MESLDWERNRITKNVMSRHPSLPSRETGVPFNINMNLAATFKARSEFCSNSAPNLRFLPFLAPDGCCLSSANARFQPLPCFGEGRIADTAHHLGSR